MNEKQTCVSLPYSRPYRCKDPVKPGPLPHWGVVLYDELQTIEVFNL